MSPMNLDTPTAAPSWSSATGAPPETQCDGGGRDELRPSPVILKDPEGVLSNLVQHPTPAPAEPCTPSWSTGACGCESWAFEAGCSRLSCRGCEEKLRTRRMLEIRRRFEGPAGRNGKPVLYTVLTVPPELRARAADPDTWRKWRRAAWKAMKLRFGGLFAVERTDPCGDRAPDKWHPHLNFLWVQVDGTKPFINVAELAEAWREIIGSYRRPSIHHAYDEHPARLQHWYWYMGRTWPDWHGSVKRHLSVRWMGKFPTKIPKPTNCEDCGQPFVFVTGLDRKAAEELAALGPWHVQLEWEKREISRIQHLVDRGGKRRRGQKKGGE